MDDYKAAPGQLVSLTGDNATVPVATGKKMVQDGRAEVSMGCIIHNLMLSLKDAESAAPAVKAAVVKVKAFASYVHRSNRASTKWLEYLRNKGFKVQKPKQSVDTRWNTILTLLQSLSEGRGCMVELLDFAVTAGYKTRAAANEMSCQDEWAIFDAIMPALC